MYNHFSSQNCVTELLYVECAIVTRPYLVKRCFCLILYTVRKTFFHLSSIFSNDFNRPF